MISEGGRFQVRQSASHRVFRHGSQKGSATVPGASGIELSKSTLASNVRQGGHEGRSRSDIRAGNIQWAS